MIFVKKKKIKLVWLNLFFLFMVSKKNSKPQRIGANLIELILYTIIVLQIETSILPFYNIVWCL